MTLQSVGIQLLLPSATQAAPAGGGGARLHHHRHHRLQGGAEDDQGQVQVGREGRGLGLVVDLVGVGAEAQDPLVAGDADGAGEAAAGGRPHADRTQGLRTLNECCETNCAPSYMNVPMYWEVNQSMMEIPSLPSPHRCFSDIQYVLLCWVFESFKDNSARVAANSACPVTQLSSHLTRNPSTY